MSETFSFIFFVLLAMLKYATRKIFQTKAYGSHCNSNLAKMTERNTLTFMINEK